MANTDYGSIRIRGARENNLKNVSVDIPKRRITVFTGVSGSGKSSLVFGTIAAESQRLINETYPAFVQQFMPHYGQPDADALENISAAIVVDQQRLGGNSRSTVATVTDAAQMLLGIESFAAGMGRELCEDLDRRTLPLDERDHVVRLAHVAHDEVLPARILRDLRRRRARLLVVVLAVDERR